MPDDCRPVGLFGGTFDPVHLGHLRLAEEAAEALGLAGIRWIPAGQPRHREAPRVTPQHRLAMVQLATAGNPLFSVDPAEAESGEASYTVPTLERLRAAIGMERPLVLLVGADAFGGLSNWHRWQELLSLAHVAVAHRPGFPLDEASLPPVLASLYRARRRTSPDALGTAPAGVIAPFAMTQLAISATQIRALLANGQSPRYLLPDAVIEYIALHHLYQTPTTQNSDGS